MGEQAVGMIGSMATVGLLSGKEQNGRIEKFSPYASSILLAVQGSGTISLRTDEVAYVSFHKQPDDKPKAHASAGLVSLKVHVAGGGSFLIKTMLAATSSTLGFYATPVDATSPVREFYFFSRGVNARENIESIGAMLVKDGVVRADGLARGIDAQQADRVVPIGQILLEQNKIEPNALEEAAALQKRKRLRIGEVLIEAGLATAKDIDFALAEQKLRRGRRLGEVLVELKLVNETDLALTLAKKFHIPFISLDDYPMKAAAMSEVSAELLEKHMFLPLDSDEKSFTIAICDPLDTDTPDTLRFQLKKRIIEVMTTPSQLKKYRAKHREAEASGFKDMNVLLKQLESGDAGVRSGQDDADDEKLAREANADSTVIKLANQIIIDGIRTGASDIHVEPSGKERTTSVRFRVDGDCQMYQEIPSNLRLPLVARLKIMASLDISERRRPQDGKIKFRLPTKDIELRVATIPTVNGNEDVVMRILAASKPAPLDQMGLSDRNFSEFNALIRKPYGLILVVGPTGSGKTTTLHSALGAINTVDLKIWTAEDPVEITQPGLRQVQMNSKIGLTFATAMRAFLRADPDVIMVGEMRDQETAQTGIEASLTGHLVFSTLHTNSAPETITRLLDMDLDPFSFADALLGVLAQRLARSLCSDCKVAYHAPQEELDVLISAYGGDAAALEPFGLNPAGPTLLYKAPGCETCKKTGYKGRLGVHELLINSDPIKAGLQRKMPVNEIRRLAMAAGMTTLLQDGIIKTLQGKTDMKQVLAVCSR